MKADKIGIMAPPAGQRASFKKNGGPDTGSIMQAEFLNVKDKAFHPYSPKKRFQRVT